jgi:signal transduction histidine kinase
MRFATKIGLSAVTAALIIGPLLGAAMFLNARALLLERIVHDQVQIAAGVMEKIDDALSGAHEDIQLIASDKFLREFLESPGAAGERADMVAEELEERAELTGPWSGMTVFDRAGRVIFTPMGLACGSSLADSPATRIAFEHALKGTPYYSDRIVCRRDGQPAVIFAAPVFGVEASGKVVGVVVSHYVWTPIQDILDRLRAPASVHLLDSKGELIGKRSGDHHASPHLLPSAEPAWVALPGGETGYAILPRAVDGDGEEATLMVDVRQKGGDGYRGVGWTLLMGMPLDVVFAPIVTLARNAGLLVFAALLTMAALFAVLGRHFMRPLGELVEGVRQVEHGHFDRKVTVRSRDEFAELANSFNAMVDTLQETRDELGRKDRLAILGQVAGSVGHELRNPLGVMSNAVYFLRTMLDGADDSVKEYLGIIRDEIARSEHIVGQLMDAVRTRQPELAAFGLAEVVGQALRTREIPAGVTVALDIPEGLPAIRVDALQVQKVFTNLLANALDAMPEGGALEIRARADAAAGTVVVEVRDTGVGIPADLLPRLFEPLFTTKARGIGLGLVVAKNLTEANGGTVNVASEAGKGTRVTVTLPAADEEEAI